MNAVTNKITGKLRDVIMFSQRFNMLDHVLEEKSRFGLSTYVYALACKPSNLMINTWLEMISIEHNYSLKEAIKHLNLLTYHDANIKLEARYSGKVVMVRKANEFSLKWNLTTSPRNLPKLTMNPNQALVRSITKYPRHIVSEKERHCFSQVYEKWSSNFKLLLGLYEHSERWPAWQKLCTKEYFIRLYMGMKSIGWTWEPPNRTLTTLSM